VLIGVMKLVSFSLIRCTDCAGG